MRQTLTVGAVLCMAVAGMMIVQPSTASTPQKACPMFYMEGVGMVCQVGPNHYEHFTSDGRSLGFSHGPDVGVRAPAGDAMTGNGGCQEMIAGLVCKPEPALPQPPRAPGSMTRAIHCVDHDAALSEYRTRVIYARSFDDEPWKLSDDEVRDIALAANSRLDIDGMRNSIHADFHTECEQGTVKVYRELLWTPLALSDFTTVTQDLQTRPDYDRPEIKYWVYFDNPNPASAGILGQGNRFDDDVPSTANQNNGNRVMYAVTFESDWTTWLHEGGHTLGAVAGSAPHTNGPRVLGGNGGHCYDKLDIMCYPDDILVYMYPLQPFNCTVAEFDCSEDDYYSTLPAPGSYLSQYWNIGGTYNRFVALDASTVHLPVDCVRADWVTEVPFTCVFAGGSADAAQVRFRVDWGDGTVDTLAPVASGELTTAQHTYTVPDDYRIHVYATDIAGSASQESGGVPWDVRIVPGPDLPVPDCTSGGPDCPITIGRPPAMPKTPI